MSQVRDNINAQLVRAGLSVTDGSALDAAELADVIRIVKAGGGSVALPALSDVAAASYDTAADQGANAGVVFTARVPGAAGNDISIEYEPGATAGSETVVVTDGAIVVGIETGVSTADQVKTAVEAEVDAVALVSVADSTGEDGSGAVVTMAAQSLAGGSDAGRLLTISPAA